MSIINNYHDRLDAALAPLTDYFSDDDSDLPPVYPVVPEHLADTHAAMRSRLEVGDPIGAVNALLDSLGL